MIGGIRHIGKEDFKKFHERIVKLSSSGIFRPDSKGNKDTKLKNIDCCGDFTEWTNRPAIDWVNGRVNELKKGRNLAVQCECCKTTDPRELSNLMNNVDMRISACKMSIGENMNKNCFANEIVDLICDLVEKN